MPTFAAVEEVDGDGTRSRPPRNLTVKTADRVYPIRTLSTFDLTRYGSQAHPRTP